MSPRAPCSSRSRIPSEGLLTLWRSWAIVTGSWVNSIALGSPLTGRFKSSRDYHYALYAAGKLHLVLGDYAQAYDFIKRAYSLGAPDVVNFDLGQACYYLGDHAKAATYLGAFCEGSLEEPAKTLLAMRYLSALNRGQPPSEESIRESITFWKGEAARYRKTDYGRAILNEVEQLQGSLDGDVSPEAGQPGENALQA